MTDSKKSFSMNDLTTQEMSDLVKLVFSPRREDRNVLLLTDVPNQSVQDIDAWRDRRRIAQEWLTLLLDICDSLGFEKIELAYFENSGSNNANFPQHAFFWRGAAEDANFSLLQQEGQRFDLETKLSETQIVFAPTHFSATAPLKLLAKQLGFRAASMPGFSRAMIPALSINYEQVHDRVMKIKTRLDEATGIEMVFEADNRTYDFFVDIRHRSGHASSGLIREPGTAWNLPSGESFIVPYEGELAETSKTEGLLPVQFGDELVLYRISTNRAVAVESVGAQSEIERQKLRDEPAYGNIAEIGFGVLEPFGIKPVGVVLLDEKLSLHIAFGRSDHFGGATSPDEFRDPKNVVHIDRIYLRELQDRIVVKTLFFSYPDERRELIMADSKYVI